MARLDQNQGKTHKTSKRGFASMDAEKQREIARKGGQSVPPEERSFSKNRGLAAEAGRKGGEASHSSRSAASRSAEQRRSEAENKPPEKDQDNDNETPH